MAAQHPSTIPNPVSSQALLTPSRFANLSSAHISKAERAFTINCPDRNLKEVTIVDESSLPVFKAESKAPFKSWSVRRSLKDANGNKLYDLRHRSSKLRSFVIEDVDEKEVCRIEDTTPYGGNSTMIDAQFGDAASGAMVEIRSFDHSGIKTVFQVNGVVFAELVLVENNDLPALQKRGLNRSMWRLRVVGGVDVALVLALTLCRVETLHVWRR